MQTNQSYAIQMGLFKSNNSSKVLLNSAEREIVEGSGENVDVQQKPPIQVALLKEGISIPCKVIFPYMPKYTKFSIIYYWINSLGQETIISSRLENVHIPPGEENKTAAVSYDHRIVPLENPSSTGTYYCKVKWDGIEKMGKGVFVLARGSTKANIASQRSQP
ncbi:hypothetical protein WISP_21566 [Willisornis vidua]|uniref:NFAM1 Ig-like domain-containing protein n=1 Tax=Willisornis vidua TaxID=1566151 RepID=A0ABQ9DTY5_9PASS|nr:hypothetical protein WISP_21566 [Willisornis vidua]